MATQKEAAKGSSKGSINRKRRNALERRSLPKEFKRQFLGADRATFRALLSAWKDSRKKPTPSVAA